MKLKIDENDLLVLTKINDLKINKYLNKMEDINEDEAVEFMEYLYDKANEYLNGKKYNETPESKTLEKVADYIYDKTN